MHVPPNVFKKSNQAFLKNFDFFASYGASNPKKLAKNFKYSLTPEMPKNPTFKKSLSF